MLARLSSLIIGSRDVDEIRYTAPASGKRLRIPFEGENEVVADASRILRAPSASQKASPTYYHSI